MNEHGNETEQIVVQAAPASSKRKPKKGSCIGVLYICNASVYDPAFCFPCGGTKVYCVHNGRLIKDTANYILVNHYTIDSKGNPKEETRIFYKKKFYPRVVEYRVTPDLPKTHPHYCAAFRNKNVTAEIAPSNCVGIEFPNPNKPFGKDIKNGRYLYWEEVDTTPHCTLTNPDKRVYKVWYYHYPKPECVKGKKPRLKGELTFRDHVIRVYKLDQKNKGEKARC